jgi:hypothetical protein
LNQASASLINQVYKLFSDTPSAAGSSQTRLEAWRTLQAWWKKRTRLEHSVGMYDDKTTAWALIDMLAKNVDQDAGGQTLLEDLRQIYGDQVEDELNDASVQMIQARLESDKLFIETHSAVLKGSLVKSIADLFQPQEETYIAYKTAIHDWYVNLQAEQKLLTADWQTPPSKAILEAVPRLDDVEKMILETIPGSPGFHLGKVDDWSSDLSQNYLALFTDGLTKIADNFSKVPAPVWETSVEAAAGPQGQILIKYHGIVKLVVSSPEPGVTVRIAKNENPETAKQFISVEQTPQEVDVSESCSYLLVSQGASGKFSKTIRLTFTNKDDDSRLISESSPRLDRAEWEYRFRNPVEKQSLVVLLKDIVKHVLDDKKIPAQDVKAAFQEALDQIDQSGK